MSGRRRVINIPNLMDEINLALNNGLHRFIITVGEKGLGKSTLNLYLLHETQKADWRSPVENWIETFRHLTFTPRQFYELYINVKDRIDKDLYKIGLDASILDMNIDTEWEEITDMVMKLGPEVSDFTKYREAYRVPAILIDDLGAHMNRQDVSIYYNPFFQQVFADLTLIRPYVACLLGTAPEIRDIPKVVLRHVTDVIYVDKVGHGQYRKVKNFLNLKGRNLTGYTKLYDGDPVEWDPLPPDIYAKYEILRHLPSRRVSQRAKQHLIDQDIERGYIPPSIH